MVVICLLFIGNTAGAPNDNDDEDNEIYVPPMPSQPKNGNDNIVMPMHVTVGGILFFITYLFVMLYLFVSHQF